MCFCTIHLKPERSTGSTSLYGVVFYELDIVEGHSPFAAMAPESIKSVIGRCKGKPE